MSITAVTHTTGNRPEFLERCKKSVEAALPAGGEHRIIQCSTLDSWARSRAEVCKEHELMAFVDDDDYIHTDALRLCLEAIHQSGLGSACTDEVEVDLKGRVLSRSFGLKTYETSTIHPRVVHHLFVFNGQYVDPNVIDLQDGFGVGVDWFIRESVILNHGCVHAPIDGYYWTKHPGQHTLATRELFGKQIPAMGQAIRDTWKPKLKGRLPIHQL